jgi:hypothetical protein
MARLFARHTRPTGRRALEAAHALLLDDVSRLRAQCFAENLEVVRLTALVEGLAESIQAMSLDLAELRRELQLARTTPQEADATVAALAAEVAGLRATIAGQQQILDVLSIRLWAVTDHDEPVDSATAELSVDATTDDDDRDPTSTSLDDAGADDATLAAWPPPTVEHYDDDTTTAEPTKLLIDVRTSRDPIAAQLEAEVAATHPGFRVPEPTDAAHAAASDARADDSTSESDESQGGEDRELEHALA